MTRYQLALRKARLVRLQWPVSMTPDRYYARHERTPVDPPAWALAVAVIAVICLLGAITK